MESSAQIDVLMAVKEQTRAEHQRAERQLNLLRPELSENEYRSLLEGFLSFYDPAERALEAGLSRSAQAELDLSARLKGAKLREDLASLGATRFPPTAELPFSTRGFEDADYLGMMYVMEGATLGGQVISRHLASALPASSQNALHFYSGYGAQTGARWKDFQNWVRAHVRTPAQKARFCASAERTFRAFNDTLADWPGAVR